MTLAVPVLSGMRVIEAAAFVAAPLGGLTLAQMGADVIRIDTLGGGLDHHRWPVTPEGVSLFWCGLNKHKRSVALDLAQAEGRELAMALISAPGPDAGLLLTNFPPRGWLDFEVLQRRRSDLIQITLQGNRHGGSAVDYTVNPRLGLPFITGPKEHAGAVNHVLPAWDLITGQMVATALLAADRHRSRTGQGQHVKLALEDVALAVMGHLGFIAEAQLGQVRERHGNDLFGAFGRDFITADAQQVMLVGLTQKQWHALCTATRLTDEMTQLATRLGVNLNAEGDRFKARDEIAALVASWVGRFSMAHIAVTFDHHGVCWGRYQTLRDLVHNDPACSLANPLFSVIEQPGIGELLAPGLPLRFGATPGMPAQPAPRLGEHTEQVLHELLGLDAAAFGRLHDKAVVG